MDAHIFGRLKVCREESSMQINSKLPLQFLNNPSPNQVQSQQTGNAGGASQSNASNPIAAVNPANQAQAAQQTQGNDGAKSGAGQAQGTTNAAEASKLDIFA